MFNSNFSILGTVSIVVSVIKRKQILNPKVHNNIPIQKMSSEEHFSGAYNIHFVDCRFLFGCDVGGGWGAVDDWRCCFEPS